MLGAIGAMLGTALMTPGLGAAAAPYAPPSRPTTSAVLPEFQDGLALGWEWGPNTTRLVSARIAVTSPDVTLVVLYRQPGRRGALQWQLTADGQSEISATIVRLEHHTYTAGNILQLTLAVPNERPQQALFTFRHGQIPTTQVSYPAL